MISHLICADRVVNVIHKKTDGLLSRLTFVKACESSIRALVEAEHTREILTSQNCGPGRPMDRRNNIPEGRQKSWGKEPAAAECGFGGCS